MANKKENRCEKCYWCEYCGDNKTHNCDDYFPLDESKNTYVDNYIEVKRREFYEEWFEYLGEFEEG